MVAKRKSRSKSKFFKKSRNNKINRRIVKQLIAGAFSPVSASRKIQSISRGRSVRQSKKAYELKSMFSQGATVYKRALQTLDFRGIDMTEQMLSRRVLDGAKFQKVDFTLSKLNGAKLNNVLADGAKFERCELKKAVSNNGSFNGAIFSNANLEGFNANSSNFSNCKFNALHSGSCKVMKSKFAVCEMKNCLFDRVEYKDAEFNKTDLTGTTFSNKIMSSNPKFIDCNLDNVTFDNTASMFTSIVSSISSNGNRNEINNLKIIYPKEKHIVNNNFIFNRFTFNNLHVSNILIRDGGGDGGEFNNCTFSNLKFDKTANSIVQLFRIKFIKCSFIDCNFGEFLGHSSQYTECIFENCNLSKCDLRACDFKDSAFVGCNMNAVKFVRSSLERVDFVNDTVLTNVDFQECEGMEGMNFQGLNLQGAKMIGISDPGLNACNFRDANLRGVQFDFSQIHGSDFTGADLTGSNVRVAEGSDQTVGIPADQEEGRAVDTHKTFYNIRINLLVDFYMEKAKISSSSTPGSNDAIRTFALTTLRKMVSELDASDADKRELNTSLEACFTQRLNTYNFTQIIAGTSPQIDFKKLIYCVIEYLLIQPKEFKDIYVQSLIMDSSQAYGPGGMSCAAGIVERFVTVMEQAAAVVKDTVPAKAEEYTELINIITNDPKSLIKAYQQEWFEFHREGGPNAFAETASLDTIMNNYKDFLEEKFDFGNLRGSNKEKIRKVIMDDSTAGVYITRKYIEDAVLFFGGRIKDNRHLNYFKMLKERFYIKNRYRKNTTRKRRAKKHIRHHTRAKKHRKYRNHKIHRKRTR